MEIDISQAYDSINSTKAVNNKIEKSTLLLL